MTTHADQVASVDWTNIVLRKDANGSVIVEIQRTEIMGDDESTVYVPPGDSISGGSESDLAGQVGDFAAALLALVLPPALASKAIHVQPNPPIHAPPGG